MQQRDLQMNTQYGRKDDLLVLKFITPVKGDNISLVSFLVCLLHALFCEITSSSISPKFAASHTRIIPKNVNKKAQLSLTNPRDAV